jgi:hypothetical protein
VLALTPHLPRVGKLMIDNRLGAAGNDRCAVGIDKLAQVGVLIRARDHGGGAIIRASCWRDRAFIIDGAMRKAAAFALAGAVLTFFGFMHGEAIGSPVSRFVRRAISSWRRAASRARGRPWTPMPRVAHGGGLARTYRKTRHFLPAARSRWSGGTASMKAIVCAPSSMRG